MKLRTDLLPHQERTVNKLRPLRVGALFMEMGLGKTRVMIELIATRADRISRVLWFCPVALKETIRREIEKHVEGAKIHVFDHRTQQGEVPEAFWHVIGIESMSSSSRVVFAADGIVDERTCVVVDESSYIKGHDSRRTRAITRIAERARYRYILNGTPLTQGVVDLYAQMRFLDRRILGYKSFHQFAANHLEYSDKYPGMIVRSHNVPWIAAKIAPYAYQVTKRECLPLPDKIYEPRYFAMSPEQRSYYDLAKAEAFEEIVGDDMHPHTLFKLFTSLQQIVSGYWNRKTEDGREWIEMENPRLDLLRATLDAIPAGEPVIIWAKFLHDVAQIRESLGDCAVTFHGGDSPAERDANLARWRAGEARYLVATPACGGHGLTLNEACHVVFFTNEFKYSNRLQAEDRNHRIGQDRPVIYLDLICSHSIDERIQKSLRRKADVVDEFRAEVDKLRETRTLREAVKEAFKTL